MFEHMRSIIAGLFFALFTIPLTAAEPVRVVPNKIDALYPTDGYMVLDDQVFLLTSSTTVYRVNGTLGSINDLRSGMRVIVQTLPPSQSSRRPVLTVIRIQR